MLASLEKVSRFLNHEISFFEIPYLKKYPGPSSGKPLALSRQEHADLNMPGSARSESPLCRGPEHGASAAMPSMTSDTRRGEMSLQ